MTCILVTGIAGFIGANFVLDWLAASDEPVVNLDKLSYAEPPKPWSADCWSNTGRAWPTLTGNLNKMKGVQHDRA